ncbi:hypothetical protein [Cerasicoccus maritimus]|uniref:hypothetical protein n=1 Tax=Cerasicoccus maritimus TaxID=490089 RepID=UPI0028524B07|nr:hypothetical protein [Cerasicoccus maritimus]
MAEDASAPLKQRGLRAFALILLLGFLYAVGYCLWYAGTPMGAHPVLDGKENLQLAWSIADGALPREPMYRAPLYPLMLSLGVGLGLPEALWPDFARLINLSSWLVSLWLVYRLAGALWNHERAQLVAMAIWAFYPVGLFFIGDPLDITLSIALLLAGLDRAVSFIRTAAAQSALASGFLLSLAALARPQLWAITLTMPVVLVLMAYFGPRATPVEPEVGKKQPRQPPRWTVFLAFVGLAIPAVLMGAFNQKLSGEFVVMPTQGAFNLWAANKPGSHGKYFAQTIEIYQGDQHRNPARVEALHHYLEDRGADASHSWRDINDYWRERTRQMILEDPLAFIGRLARKGYYLLNQHEQYNNKTYSVHRELSPFLRFNYLGWGILLVAATPLVFWGRKNPLVLTVLLTAVIAYSGGLILTYVSARFRLPLAPVLAIVAGGWATAPWRMLSRKWLVAVGVAMAAASLMAFSSFCAVREPPTEVQDYLLLGYAALDAQLDDEALAWADQALSVDSDRVAARELRIVAMFNLDLATLIDTGKRPSGAELKQRLDDAQSLANVSPRVLYIAGVYAWWNADSATAISYWRMLLVRNDSVSQSALTGLVMAGDQTAMVKQALQRLPDNDRSPSLQVALAYKSGAPLNAQGQELLQQLELLYGRN